MQHTAPILVADLSQSAPNSFEIRPDPSTLPALAAALGLDGLRKLSFSGDISARGARDWLLTARLGATVIQPCVVTLAPVTTRIDSDVRRLFVADMAEPDAEEIEIPDDDEAESLGREIDPVQVMTEALALAIPVYPRAKDAALDTTTFTEPGKIALSDADLKPFAGLAALKDKLNDE